MSKIQEDFQKIIDLVTVANAKEGKVRAYFVVCCKDDNTVLCGGAVAKGTPVSVLLGPVEDMKLSIHQGAHKVVREK